MSDATPEPASRDFATASERHAHDSLRAAGFGVRRIRPSAIRTADFFVSDPGSTYLFEVTDRHASPFLADLIGKARAQGVAWADRYIARNPNLSSKLGDKADQLSRTPVSADFRVIWLAVMHQDHDDVWRQLTRTLYGYAELSAWQGSDLVGFRPCLYYHPAAFAALRDLEAVVFARREGRVLLVNALSPRAQTFRRSRLFSHFQPEHRRDPADAPAGILVVDPDLDRTDPLAAWRYLKDRYGWGTSEVVEAECRACAWIDPGEAPSPPTPDRATSSPEEAGP